MSDDRVLLAVALRPAARREIAASHRPATSSAALPVAAAQNVALQPAASAAPQWSLPGRDSCDPSPSVRPGWGKELSQVTNLVPRLEVRKPTRRPSALTSIPVKSAMDTTSAVKISLKSQQSKIRKVDDGHLHSWLAMTKAERTQETIVGYVRKHQLSQHTFKHLANLNGLRLAGEQQLDPSLVKNEIHTEHLQAWRNLGEEGRRQTGREGYARENGLPAHQWLSLAKLEGDGLLPLAKVRLDNNPTEAIEDYHLEAWLKINRKKRGAQGLSNYATSNNLNLHSWLKVANLDGLTPLGWQRLAKQPTVKVTDSHRLEWSQMNRQDRQKQGVAGYARANHLNLNSWIIQANLDGLSPRGHQLMDRTETNPITHQHLNEWQQRVNTPDNILTAQAYARHNNLKLANWLMLANNQGLTLIGSRRLSIGEGKYNSIQRAQLQAWKEMPADERQLWDAKRYADQYHFNLLSWRKYANDSGLTAAGEHYLSQTEYLAVEDYHLTEWQQLTQQAGNHGSLFRYATDNNLSINTLRLYASNEGLTAAGEKRLRGDKPDYGEVTSGHLVAWQNMDRQQRKHSGYLEKNNLNPARWRLLANLDGLTISGQQTLNPASTHPPTLDELRQWKQMPQPDRDRVGGTTGFAAQHQIALRSFTNLAKKDGLQPLGEARLTAPAYPNEITLAHLAEWQRMAQARKMDIAASLAYCATHGFNPDSWLSLASTKGLTRKGSKRLNQLPVKSGKSKRLKIKPDPQTAFIDNDDVASWRPQFNRLYLSVRRDAPLLINLHSGKSVTATILGNPNSIILSDIEQALPELEEDARERIMKRLLKQAQEIVRLDGKNLESRYYHKIKMTFDEKREDMGLGIVATEDFAIGDIIGPYPGAFLQDDLALSEACKKAGGQNVLTYLWGAKSAQGYISGYHNAGPMALVNTARMKGHLSANENNAAAIYINDILPLYIAIRRIAKEEAILINYGNFYAADGIKQDTLNNDIVRIIAIEKAIYFAIHNQEGIRCYFFGPTGILESLPEKIKKVYTLQQRLNERGIYQYDVLRNGKAGKISIPDGENNLYHAMAKALYPTKKGHFISAKITEMKQKVDQVHRVSETIIKSEPLDENMSE